MALPDQLTDPTVLTILGGVLALVLLWQRTLTWRKYRRIHRLKTAVFPLFSKLTPSAIPARLRRVPILGRVLTFLFAFDSFVNEKKYRGDDAEYLRTDPRASYAVFKDLVAGGGSPHLINSIKRRETPDGEVEYSDAHIVWTHDDETQTEAYLFENDDGTTDVYVHHENSVTNPEAHLTRGQSDGDPRGVVTEALATVESDSTEDAIDIGEKIQNMKEQQSQENAE